jgi:hypothetical protein
MTVLPCRIFLDLTDRTFSARVPGLMWCHERRRSWSEIEWVPVEERKCGASRSETRAVLSTEEPGNRGYEVGFIPYHWAKSVVIEVAKITGLPAYESFSRADRRFTNQL